MAEKTEAELNEELDFLEVVRERYRLCVDADRENRDRAREALAFRNLEQWDEKTKNERQNDPEGARPCLVVDKLNQHVMQVVNDERQNRPQIKVRPVDDKGDPEVAKIYDGILRHIQDKSRADVAYDTGFECAVDGGFGFWRVLTEYNDPMSFEQDIRIKRLRNRFSVHLDPARQEPDGSDAKYGFILYKVQQKDFKKEFGKKGEDALDGFKYEGKEFTDWYGDDWVVYAEYFWTEYVKQTIVLMEDGSVMSKQEHKDSHTGIIQQERVTSVPKIRWRKVTGTGILEDGEWVGDKIPIIEVIGNELDIEGKVMRSGLIRPAMDAQRVDNYATALDLNTLLPTPCGWITMRDIEDGDRLFDESGKPCQVTGTSPVYINHRCFEIEFDNGETIVADAAHRWKVEDRGMKKIHGGWKWSSKILTTEELDPKRHLIRVSQPIQIDERQLPIHPYLLGIWLGDGTSAAPQITEDVRDVEALRERLKKLGYDCGEARIYDGRPGAANFTVYGIKDKFHVLGLLHNKHIPAIYLRSSASQRLALLQGLMDSDGTVNKATRQCSLTTSMEAVRDGVLEIGASLGIKMTQVLYEASAVANSDYVRSQNWKIMFSCGLEDDVFQMPRKREILNPDRVFHHRRTKQYRIKAVRAVASRPVKCVSVDSPSHLYLAGRSMIPTHNSAFIENVALAPRASYVAATGQIEDDKDLWKTANRRNISVLPYKPVSVDGVLVAAPRREPPPGVSTGWLSVLEQSEHNIQASMGRYNATLGAPSNETSGKAISARNREGDTGSFHFSDNLTRSLRHTGQMIVDIIPKIYDTRRIARIIGEDGEPGQVTVDPNLADESGNPMGYAEITDDTGKIQKIYNLGVGKYDVTIIAGPSYTTRRLESADAMMEISRGNKEFMAQFGDIIFKSQDWPGAQQIADRFRKMLPPNLRDEEPTDIEKQKGQIQQAAQMLGQKEAELTHAAEVIQEKTQALQEAEYSMMEREQTVQNELQKIEYEKKFMALKENFVKQMMVMKEKSINDEHEAALHEVVSQVEKMFAEHEQQMTEKMMQGMTGQFGEMHNELKDKMQMIEDHLGGFEIQHAAQ